MHEHKCHHSDAAQYSEKPRCACSGDGGRIVTHSVLRRVKKDAAVSLSNGQAASACGVEADEKDWRKQRRGPPRCADQGGRLRACDRLDGGARMFVAADRPNIKDCRGGRPPTVGNEDGYWVSVGGDHRARANGNVRAGGEGEAVSSGHASAENSRGGGKGESTQRLRRPIYLFL